MISPERMAKHIVNILHTSVSAYDAEGNKCFFAGNDNNESLLDYGDELRKKLLSLAVEDRPFIHLEGDLLDFGIFKHQGKVWIIGPVSSNYDNLRADELLRKYFNLPEGYKANLAIVELKVFAEILVALAETMADVNDSFSELFREGFADNQENNNSIKNYIKVHSELRESNTIHNPYSQELIEQACIEHGDLSGLQKSFDIAYEGQLGKLSKNQLRSAKNLAITVCALASRSAIRGGLKPEEAFSMSDAYIQSVEDMKTEETVLVSIRLFEEKLTRLVAEYKNSEIKNPTIIKCMDLVTKNLYYQATVESIANEMAFSPEYLTRLFRRETGKNLSQYIREAKVEEAKKLLVFTKESYKQIGAKLCFSSQSHFINVFRKYTGETPAQFRKHYS